VSTKTNKRFTLYFILTVKELKRKILNGSGASESLHPSGAWVQEKLCSQAELGSERKAELGCKRKAELGSK